jgi:hypothetical protein
MLAGGTSWLLGSRRAQASVAVAATLPSLVARSSLVAFSTSLAAASRWEEIGGTRRIVTYNRVRIDEDVVGEPETPELWVRTLGGDVGDIAQIVHGEAELVIGEPCLLFVRAGQGGVHVVTELAQGHYPLRDDGQGTLRLLASPRLGVLLNASGSAVRLLHGKSRAEAVDLLRGRHRRAK